MALGIALLLVGTIHLILALPTAKLPRTGRDYGMPAVISPKVMIITMFSREAAPWLTSDYNLTAQNITVPGFTPTYPDVNCNAAGIICHLTTHEGEINAATTLDALTFSPLFNLKKTYFLITGIAGINPAFGTIGSITFAKYAVQVDLTYQFDTQDLPPNWPIGLVPLGAKMPNTYPGHFYGTELYELNEALLNRASSAASLAQLSDDSNIAVYRNQWPDPAARQPPSVVKCDTATANVYWSGRVLGEYFANYTKIVTMGTGEYCTSQQEDNASLGALIRGAARGVLDFGRIIVLRAGSDFDRQPPTGFTSVELIVGGKPGSTVSGGSTLAVSNMLAAGRLVVDDIVGNWDILFASGSTFQAPNYIGDIFNTLKNPKKADFYNPAIKIKTE